jgi:recombinational DNA repair protein RecR
VFNTVVCPKCKKGHAAGECPYCSGKLVKPGVQCLVSEPEYRALKNCRNFSGDEYVLSKGRMDDLERRGLVKICRLPKGHTGADAYFVTTVGRKAIKDFEAR